MRRCRAAALAAALVLATVDGAAAQVDGTVVRTQTVSSTETWSPRWEVSLLGQVGVPRGFVKVGEFERAGTKLRLHDDLGIDTFEVGGLGVVWHITDRDALRGRFEYTFLYGSTHLGEDAAFNGALIGGGQSVSTRPIFARVTGLYEHTFVGKPNGAFFAAGGGLTFVYLHWKMSGTLSPQTVGHETGEDFYAQELPIPLMSLRGEYPLTERLRLVGTVAGGVLPKVDSLRTEGGTVKLAQAYADVFAGVRYAITPRLFADGGYTYTYFSQHETSREDDNKVLFLGHGFGFALTYAF